MNTSKTALITGAASRVGRSIALHLARNGWDIAIHYRDSQAGAEETAAEIRALGRNAIPLQAELAQDTHARLLKEASTALGPVTALINSAALFERDDLSTLDPARFRAHMDINLLAPILLAQAFVVQLGTEEGHIINILDGCEGLCLSPKFLSYTISKHALHDATLLLAQELAPRVRVNAVAPGLTLPKPGEEEMFARLSAKKPHLVTPPEEIAQAVLHLLQETTVTGFVIAPEKGKESRG